jgi:Heavy metal associated domain 2
MSAFVQSNLPWSRLLEWRNVNSYQASGETNLIVCNQQQMRDEVKLEDIRLMHAMPGRIRFKLDRLRRNPDYARDIEARLAAVDGIHRVKASSLTGSVVATFDPALLESLNFHLAVASAFGIEASDLNPEYLAKWYSQQKGGILTAHIMDNWRQMVPLALCLLGVRGLLFTNKVTFPLWYDYLWYAFGTYSALHPSGTTADDQSTSKETPAV